MGQYIVQRQVWTEFTRYLIVTDNGSVQMECYPQEQWFGSQVWLYALWVDEGHRRKHTAARLVNRALSLLKNAGYESVALDWKLKDTPEAVLDWYLRLGFEVVATTDGGECKLLKKLL